MMQLDDVVASTTTGPRVEEAMHRLVGRERSPRNIVPNETFSLSAV